MSLKQQRPAQKQHQQLGDIGDPDFCAQAVQ